jgi:hypothetical protein
MDFKFARHKAVAAALTASVLALTVTASAAFADTDLETAYPGAMLQKACVTSGAVTKMEETGQYDLSSEQDRIDAMNDRIFVQKSQLDDIGVTICNEMQRVGYLQAENGLWNEPAVTANLNVLEMDAGEFNFFVAMTQWSTPEDIAADYLNAHDGPQDASDIEGLFVKAYEIEALAGAIEFGSYINLDVPNSRMTIDDAKTILANFETEDFGPGDNFGRYGVEYMNAVSDVMTVDHGVARLDHKLLEITKSKTSHDQVIDPLKQDAIRESPEAHIESAPI